MAKALGSGSASLSGLYDNDMFAHKRETASTSTIPSVDAHPSRSTCDHRVNPSANMFCSLRTYAGNTPSPCRRKMSFNAFRIRLDTGEWGRACSTRLRTFMLSVHNTIFLAPAPDHVIIAMDAADNSHSLIIGSPITGGRKCGRARRAEARKYPRPPHDKHHNSSNVAPTDTHANRSGKNRGEFSPSWADRR